MRIALIEPYISVEALKSYADKTEPSHMLGMFNILKNAGYDVVLLDAYSSRFTEAQLIEWLEKEEITHAGFTVYDYSPCLSYVQHVFENLPEGITTIIGGPGPTYCMERMIKYLEPDWLVKGPGEGAIIELMQEEFSGNNFSRRLLINRKTIGVDACSVILDEIPFERPYSLEAYDFQASPRIQTGCVGKCIFCSGAYQKKFDYLSVDKAAQLIDYLVNQKHAEVISPCGSDFTAIPRKANKFINVLLDGNYGFKEFRPGVRLDTFSSAVRLDPEGWKKLGSSYKVKLESSIESFSMNRLKRLGKNIPSDFFEDISNHLKNIFSTCECTIVLGRIAVDPTITIDEFIEDCTGFRKLLNEFSERVTIGGMLMNQFVALPGTPSTENENDDNPWIKNVLHEPAMEVLQMELLNNDQFRMWCRLAENISDFSERNFVFDEILRISEEKAREIKSVCPV